MAKTEKGHENGVYETEVKYLILSSFSIIKLCKKWINVLEISRSADRDSQKTVKVLILFYLVKIFLQTYYKCAIFII